MENKQNKKVILASASPRRQQLLEQMGLSFSIVVPAIDETLQKGKSIADEIKRLSLEKAEQARALSCEPGSFIIAADTVVVLEDEVLGKPIDAEDARRMLRKLSGKEHYVLTGMTILTPEKKITHVEQAFVRFCELDEELIDAYIKTKEPLDKAGAYGIQDRGALLVERIDGDFYAVMGLPICLLGKKLRENGVQW